MINPNYSRSKFIGNIYNNMLKYARGFITCSHSLKDYYSPLLSENIPIHISPLIINIDKFIDGIVKEDVNVPYIGYCGSLGNNKDGLPNLIESFSIITEKYESIELHLAGNGDQKTLDELHALVNKLGLNSRVVFTGNLLHSQMPSFLANAKLLVLARPNNKQAEGGFPSKIGEYMSVQVPIVVTNVGELHHYLIDKYNCFMAEADSIESFAAKVVEALEFENINSIVSNAFETVLQFDSKVLFKKREEVV